MTPGAIQSRHGSKEERAVLLRAALSAAHAQGDRGR
ncbi:MAG: hypothetical protein JWO83_179 [Caulobacteraceae bacterium]|nr:hypothetical protein [Caulobacteraceae bacterium]